MAMEVFKLVGRITYEGQAKVEAGLTALGKKVEQAEKKLSAFGEKASQVGEKATAFGEGVSQKVGLPLLALGGLGVAAANDIESAFGKLAASTNRTTEETNRMKEAARDLWKGAYGADVYEAAEAVATVDRNVGGLAENTDELKKLTEQAFILRDAFGYEIQESSRAATALMQNFGVTGTDAMDMIAVAAQKGGDYSGELIDTINEYSTYFGAAGFSAEQMFNTLLAGAQNGAWNLDKVGDAVKEFNIRAKDGSETTAEGFKAIGFNADEMAQKIANGGEEGQRAFMATIAALSQMDDKVAMNQAGVALFGTQWEDLEKDVMIAMGNSEGYLGEFAGTTAQMGDELYNNFGTRLTGAIRKVQDALAPLGNVIISVIEPGINKLAQGVEKLSNWFGSLTGEQQKWIVILGIAAAAAGPLLVIIGTLISAVGTIATAIGAVGLVTVGWIAGIALLGAALVAAYMNIEWFRNGVNAVFSFIAAIVKPIIADFTNFFKLKIAEMKSWWDQNGAMIQQAFQNVWAVIQTIIKVAVAVLMPIVQGFINGIKNIISGGLDIITGVIQFFAALFTGNWSAMFAAVKQILSGAIQLIWGLFEAGFAGRIMGVLRMFAGSAGGIVSGFVAKVISFFTGFVSKGQSMFSSFADTVILKMMYGFDRVKAVIMAPINATASFFSSIFGRIGGAVGGFVSSTISRFSSMGSSVYSTVVGRFNSISNAIMNPIRSAVNFVQGQVSRISGFFRGLNISLPKIKLPHFRLSGSFSIAPPRVPKLAVDWYAKGGVFGGPSIIGVGEEPGVSEAVIPLKPSVLKQIGEGIAAQMGGYSAATAAGPIVINVQLEGRTIARAIIEDIDELLQRKSKRK